MLHEHIEYLLRRWMWEHGHLLYFPTILFLSTASTTSDSDGYGGGDGGGGGYQRAANGGGGGGIGLVEDEGGLEVMAEVRLQSFLQRYSTYVKTNLA